MDIIENPMTGEKIKIAKSEFPECLNWDEAMAACAALGNGWRLPTKYELHEMYINMDKIGHGKWFCFWSSTADINGSAWDQDFETGDQGTSDKNSKHGVRAVRTI